MNQSTSFSARRVSFPLMRQNALRLAILSALGVWGCSLTGDVRAGTCWGTGDDGSYAYMYGMCKGDDGVDKNNEKDGETGGDENGVTTTRSHSIDAATYINVLGSQNTMGVVTGATTGGAGVDEGTAGNGGQVTVTNAYDVTLTGTTISNVNSLILAGSYGGQADQDNDNNDSNGGQGGFGQLVTVQNTGNLTIEGTVDTPTTGLFGINATSTGGAGGQQNDPTLEYGDQIGGTGGNGSTVTVTSSGDINLGSSGARLRTNTVGAAISATSVGGMGGQKNGNAGTGGTVQVTQHGSATSYWQVNQGAKVFGIKAETSGGDGTASTDDSDNGGNGGGNSSTWTQKVTVDAYGSVLLDVEWSGSTIEGAGIAARALGGKGGGGPDKDHSGGNGGTAGTVAVTLHSGGSVTTQGENLVGIAAQSLGGQGGDGADSTALAGQAGGGGFGGDASQVTVQTQNDTTVTTNGNFAVGVVAQSIGGGGGTGSDFVSVLGGQGGNGGNGGNAGQVNVTTAGSINTSGQHAYGVLAQSIAGSGGAGGADTSSLVSLGGGGAGGGSASSVQLTNSGSITTSGYNSHGMVAQSIGGGGGASGSATGLLSVGGNSSDGTSGSDGSSVILNNSGGTITTTGNAAIGMVGQSIGGGGGSGGDSIGVLGVGGAGGGGGSGGSVTFGDLGGITTSGQFSPGVVAQSIGGGGGNGGDTFTASVGVSIAVGGSASGGGNGGEVCLSNHDGCSSGTTSYSTGNIVTHGNYSPGIIAQSVGGGGGTGGSVKNVSVASFAALQLGGSGGDGGHADDVKVGYSNLNISTGGAHSTGVLAQSIGGGGGNGGASSYYDATIGFNAALVVGGSGGYGGTGNAVTVNLASSHIATGMDYDSSSINPDTYAPNDSFGILAQTIGGGGGNGGSSSASDAVVAVPTGEGVSAAFNFESAVGGSGGSGGSACPEGDSSCVTEVVLNNGSTVTTLGDGSHAIVAQSIGGGGGNGGDSSVLATTIGDETTVSATAAMTLGGTGSAGGNGGGVNISLGDSGSAYAALPPALLTPPSSDTPPSSSIITYGDYANGVVAQSIGGGGGNGGIGSSNAYTHGGPTSVKATLALGGTGGAGGVGGDVDITLNPNFVIRTLGSGSRGIVAQSIGGGGGTSQGGTLSVASSIEDTPSTRLQVGLGATGASGATGGTINATLQGAIRTEGGDADGVLLQSIGGGGGLGGSLGADASSYPILDRIGTHSDNQERLDDTGTTYSFGVDVGGNGGTGGNGGAVNTTFAGKIGTSGDWADGLVVQSIGGGGGTGGSSTASGSKVQANAIISVGGTGGAGGNGGELNVYFDDEHNNNISTAGYYAYGVLLQSIGGGGGQGGDGSDQAYGTITVGASNGGSGGQGGNGGTIQVTDGANGPGWLTVTTAGDDAPGLAMQSIGGGGGIGGAGNSASKLLAQNSHAMQVSVGGSGGLAGNGGVVNVTTGLNSITSGDRAYGALAQSIGGGGGLGGAGEVQHYSGVALGGTAGVSGDGETVTLNLTSGSYIKTSGAGAHGLIAQSIGGGGGIAGDTSVGTQLGTSSWKDNDSTEGSSGSGKAVTVNVDGDVQTSGVNAFGIIAQSIGGGGGLGGSADGGFAGSTGVSGDSAGSGGDVTVTQSGLVNAGGSGGTGIFAQSDGPEGTGVVTVNVNGTVAGGSGSEANGVWIAGNNSNVLNVATDGAVTVGSGGTAVRYSGVAGPQYKTSSLAVADVARPTLSISNAGMINGDINCQNGSGSIACDVENKETGTLSGATSYQANIDNAGLVAIGRTAELDTLTVSGDFTQRSTGTLQANADFSALRASHLVVKGDTKLDGQVSVVPLALLPGREVAVATLEGGIQGTPMAYDSPVVDYDATLQGNQVHMRVVSADFAPPSMNLADNQGAVAAHVQSTWNQDGGSNDLAPLYAALDMASRGGAKNYSDRLADLSPGVAVAPAAQMQASMARFTGAMMSCPMFQGADALSGEQDCLWGQVSGVNTNQDGDNGISGFSFDGVTYQFGGQRQVSPGWFLGGSVAYENTHMRGDDGRVTGKGDSGYAGLVLKREAGPWTFSAALGGGYGQYDIDRGINFPGMQSTASSDVDVYGAGMRLRIARTFAAEQFYLKPYVDLDAFYTRMPGYSESRKAEHLDIESSDKFIVGLSPTLEIGGRVPLTKGTTMRPYMYAGASFLSDDEYKVKAKLQGAQAGSGSFESSIPMDDVIGRIGAGIQVSNAGGVDFRLQYDGEFSSHVQSHRGSLKLMVPF